MNFSEFYDDDNATHLHNQSRCDALRYPTRTILATFNAMLIASVAVGIPGNILSAIVWLRRHIAGKMSSAVYLAALSISDLLVLLAIQVFSSGSAITSPSVKNTHGCHGAFYIRQFTVTLEPLLVLGFSVERLIAILRPLQVCLSALRVLMRISIIIVTRPGIYYRQAGIVFTDVSGSVGLYPIMVRNNDFQPRYRKLVFFSTCLWGLVVWYYLKVRHLNSLCAWFNWNDRMS